MHRHSCTDMFIDMSRDIWIDMCADMWIEMWIDMYCLPANGTSIAVNRDCGYTCV